MQGHFNVSLIDAQGLKDQDFLRAKAAGSLIDLLQKLPVVERCKGKNLVFDNFAAYTHYYVMSGGGIDAPYVYTDSANAALGTILLVGTSSDPTYTEQNNYGYTSMHSMVDSVNGSSAGKRFIEDDIDTPELAVLASGQEGIVFRSRWLYLPQEGTTSTVFINSLAIYFSSNAQEPNSSRRGIIARIRLKNSAGTKITLHKSSKQVLLVEYEFTLLCV